MITGLCVALGGGVGAALRYELDAWLASRFARTPALSTSVINVLGSFVLGLVAVLTAHTGHGGTWWAVLGVGLCGGFTTFSTAMVDAVRLVQQGRAPTAAAVVGGTAVICVGAAALGAALGRLLV